MPDDEMAETLGRLEQKIDSLESRLARQSMTPGQRAAEARAAMRRGYEQSAREREESAEGGGAA